MSELKPCPFCGGYAHLLLCDYYGEDKWGIECEECYGGLVALFDEKEEAIEAWNTRHEETCEGCIKIGIHDWCEDCARSKPDLYHTTEETDA